MKPIRSASVIGSGVMGAQIAAQLANCGIPCLLLDLASEGKNKNSLADNAKAGLKKIKPSPLYTADTLNLITTGNLDDDLTKAAQSDWVIEAIIEKEDIKLSLFEKLAPLVGPNTIISTNTSGIPLKTLSQKFNEDLASRFLGTHFFNPPRYLKLVEVIETQATSIETVERIEHTLFEVLNKIPVPCLDSPSFIANRVGVHAMVNVLKITREFNLTIEEIDKLTGSLMGRPKTGTFRLADLVGLDTLCHIINNMNGALPSEGAFYTVDPILQKLFDDKRIGNKVGAGFYKKDGKTIFSLDLATGDYREAMKPDFPELKDVFKASTIEKKLSRLFEAKGRGAEAAQAIVAETLAYASQVAQGISDNLKNIDDAMELGFGWEIGPFKTIDAIGIDSVEKVLNKRNMELAQWVKTQAEGDSKCYHVVEKGLKIKNLSGDTRQSISSRGFELKLHKQVSRPVKTNSAATLWDIGDRVAMLEFHTKMNAQDLESLQSVIDAVDMANNSYDGLVIANQAPHFCAGANIGMILMDAINGEYENIEFAIKQFQRACMAIKYSGTPVVVSAHGMALGGGCEFVLHSQRPVLSPETYMGLVEAGVGLLPAGGGTKEMALRGMDKHLPGPKLKNLVAKFEAIAMAKVSTSAYEAFDIGYLDKRAIVVSNDATRIDRAKAEVLAMSRAGYRPPAPAVHIEALGTDALAAFEAGVFLVREAGYASEHDQLIARSVGKIMAGGNVAPGTIINEEYLLDLEREEFMMLVGTKKTQERIEHMLKNGKPLRN
jgi:3-hydroxyacyl-CoA dehydrogenase